MAQIQQNIFLANQKIEKLRYQLSQYKTLLGVCPFNKEMLKGDRGLRGKDFKFEDFTEQQLTDLEGKSSYEIWLESGKTGDVIDFISDVTYLNTMSFNLNEGDLIVNNYQGNTIEIIDGELVLNNILEN